MLRNLLVLAAIAGLGIYGYLQSDRAKGLVAPEAIKVVECPPPLPQDTDVFQLRGTKIAMRCVPSGRGASNLKAWEKGNYFFIYAFRKRPLGGFDRKEPESSGGSASRTEAQYVLKASILPDPGREVREEERSRHEHLKIRTPAAFAADTGPETVFHCEHGGLHWQMKPWCTARFQSPGLHWYVSMHIAPSKDPRSTKTEDLRADVTEAYELLAAHVVPPRQR